MKRIILTIGAIICLAGQVCATPARAQAQDALEEEQITPIIVPVITSEDAAQVGKPILFDASDSSLLPDPAPQPVYRWSFSDTPVKYTGKEFVRTFERTGKYTVNLTVQQGGQEAQTGKEFFVFDQRVLLVTDKDRETGLSDIEDQAARNGVQLEVITVGKEETEFLTEENLVKTFTGQSQRIEGVDGFIFYTNSSLGLRAFTRYWRALSDPAKAEALRQKWFTAITDTSIEVSAGNVQQAFRVIHPTFILLTRKEAINPIFESANFSAVASVLDQRVIEYRVIDERSERSGAFLLSRLVTKFVAQGVPTNVVFLLLAFPFIAFIIAFAREVLGISAFGIYTPAMIATAFLILGIGFGLVTLFVVIVVGWLVRWMISRVELLYIPRTALVLSTTALSFLLVIWVLLLLESASTISLAVFPMLVMSTVTEKFLSAQQEEGFRQALGGVVRTVIVVVAAYYAVTWGTFVNLISSTPEYVILPLLALFILGKFTGLRISEYFRFRSLLREGAEEE